MISDGDPGGAPGSARSSSSHDPVADVRRLETLSSDLAAVESALRRLDQGSYGTCEVCGETLPPEDLAATPALARCDAHG